MILVLGCLLGAGLVLVLSPFLWPASRAEASGSRTFDGWRARLAQAGFGSLPVSVVVTDAEMVATVPAAVRPPGSTISTLSPTAMRPCLAGASSTAIPTFFSCA